MVVMGVGGFCHGFVQRRLVIHFDLFMVRATSHSSLVATEARARGWRMEEIVL